jgi:uncharacterized repeat protein (TIGR01451 family)
MNPLKLSNRSPQPSLLWVGALSAGLSLLGATPAFAAGEIQVVTTFDPIIIQQGGPGKLKYTIRNNETALTGVALTKTIPVGFVLDIANFPTNAVSAANSCGLTIGTSTANTLRITGGTLPAINTAASPPVPGRCDLELPIIGTKAPSETIDFAMPVGQLSAGGFSNSEISPGSVTVRQLGNLSPTMTFGSTVLPSRGRTRFTLGLVNGTGVALTGARFTTGFSIPDGFTIVGSSTNTCPGASLDLGATGLGATPPIIRLLSGTIPAGGCSFEFEFEGPTVATEQTFGPISWAANDLVTALEVSNNASTSNSGTIEGGIKIEQSFSLNPVFINEDSTMTIRMRNANGTAVANETLESFIIDNGGTADFKQLRLGGTAGDITSTCPTQPIAAYDAATGRLTLTNLSIPTGVLTPAGTAAVGECTVTLKMVGSHDSANAVPTFTSIGTYTSTIATGQLTAVGEAVSNQKAVTNAGLTIQDLGPVGGTGVGVGVGIRTQYSSNGVDFGTTRVAASNRGVMRIWLDNTAGETLNGVAIGGTGVQLPANLRIADGGSIDSNCTAVGNITAPVGGATVTMTGGVIPRRGSCYLDINVVSDNFNLTPGYTATAAAGVISTTAVTGQNNRSYTNAVMTAGPTDYQGNPTNYLEVNDFLTVYPSVATPIVAPNADARINLRLSNSQSVAKAGAKLRYRLPFRISGDPDYEASAACGLAPADFTIDGVFPNQDLVINSLNIPASTGSKAPAAPVEYGDGKDGECNIAFDVVAPGTPGTSTVSVPVGTLKNATETQENRRVETATFAVQALTLELSQRFTSYAAPATTITELVGAEPAFLEIVLTNPTSNPLPLTGIVFDDDLNDPTALFYPGARPFTTCVGASGPAIPTANATTRRLGITGVDLARGASCLVRYPVTTLSVTLLANAVPVDSAISLEGAKSNQDGDSITTSANINLVKDFETPTLSVDGLPQIATDGVARLNLTVLNATTRAYNDLAVTDNLPAGLKVAANPDIVSTCGTVSAPAEATSIRLNGGSIPANAPCKISVNVTSLLPSPATGYENNIPIGGLTAGIFKNSRPAIANLLVTGTLVERPGLRLVKRATALTPARATTAIDLTPISVDDSGSFDNAPGWPGTLTPAGISNYLKGATDTAQLDLPGKQSLTSGTEVEYSGYYLSNGTVGTNNTKLCDFIPKDTTYVPGSLVWVKGDGTSAAVADATGFLPTTATFPAACAGTNNSKGAVLVDLGNLTTTGTGSYGYFKFKVKID